MAAAQQLDGSTDKQSTRQLCLVGINARQLCVANKTPIGYKCSLNSLTELEHYQMTVLDNTMHCFIFNNVSCIHSSLHKQLLVPIYSLSKGGCYLHL